MIRNIFDFLWALFGMGLIVSGVVGTVRGEAVYGSVLIAGCLLLGTIMISDSIMRSRN